jgi:hypothetical protein
MAEQRMIESLAEHGVDAADLVPALMTTHTVKNPEFDPEAKKRAEAEEQKEEEDVLDTETEAPPPPYQPEVPAPPSPRPEPAPVVAPEPRRKAVNPFGDDEDEEELPVASSSTRHTRPTSLRLSSFDDDQGDIGASTPTKSKSGLALDEDDGDIGRSTTPVKPKTLSIPSRNASRSSLDGNDEEDEGDLSRSSTPVKRHDSPEQDDNSILSDNAAPRSPVRPAHDLDKTPTKEDLPLPDSSESELPPNALPALPGVSTSLTAADEVVTLDIRWTVVGPSLCEASLCLHSSAICSLFSLPTRSTMPDHGSSSND